MYFIFHGLCLRLMVFHGGITVINVRGVGTKRPTEDKILFLPLFKENLLINGIVSGTIWSAVINPAKDFIRSQNPIICLVHGHFCTFWGVLSLLILKGRLENNIIMSHHIMMYCIQLLNNNIVKRNRLLLHATFFIWTISLCRMAPVIF